MRLSRLQLRGFSTAYPALVDLPLGDIEPGLVAVVGGNGAGKTTLLETVPACLYRRLPARDDADPVRFATSDDSFIDLEYTFGDLQLRSRLNFNGPARKTDATLEQRHDGEKPTALNNGQRSTYDVAIRARVPSFDLFLNSSFAAQGRGDAFTRASGTERKELFVEFLNQGRLLRLAKVAKDAADLAADSRLRLTVQREQLERDTAPELRASLDVRAVALAATGGAAERALADLRETIADLESREKLAGDQVAAFAAAQLRERKASTELQTRRQELTLALTEQRTVEATGAGELENIRQRYRAAVDASNARLTGALGDIEKRIAGNKQIQEQALAIRGAVAALAEIDQALEAARLEQQTAQHERDGAGADLARAEQAVSALAVPQRELVRAQADSALLTTVPCGGTGDYAACQFLVNAKTAEGRIAELEAKVATMTAAITARDALKTRVADIDVRLVVIKRRIADLTTDRQGHDVHAKYSTALAESDARLQELTKKRDEVTAASHRELTELQEDTAHQHDASAARLADRVRAVEQRQGHLSDQVVRLEQELAAALEDLEAARSGNSLAVQLQAQLAEARREAERVVRTLADVAAGQAEIARAREAIAVKQRRLTDVLGRLAQVEHELLEWQFFAKGLAKGGLPDLEIDAAGPQISAVTNELLHACYGTRFSLELVTQVERADGAGMKDEFTVRVFDNNATDGRGWRDISELSGGEKVVVQEALMCAIALHVAERSELPIRTLFRDETGAALEPENAVRYVQMLRKVRALGGFEHVYFISHTPAAYALADTQIRVGNGTARIVRPPFEEAA